MVTAWLCLGTWPALSLTDRTGFYLCMHAGKMVSVGPEEDTCCHLIQGIPGTYIHT